MQHTNPNSIDYVELPIQGPKQLNEACAFYEAAFYWDLTLWGRRFADSSSSGLSMALNACPEYRPSKPLLHVRTQNLYAARAKVLEAGGSITRDVHKFPGGKRFLFADPTGNELAVWSNGVFLPFRR